MAIKVRAVAIKVRAVAIKVRAVAIKVRAVAIKVRDTVPQCYSILVLIVYSWFPMVLPFYRAGHHSLLHDRGKCGHGAGGYCVHAGMYDCGTDHGDHGA